MSVFAAAIITFLAFVLLSTHLTRISMRKLVGYALPIDIIVHASVLIMFMGGSTLGLLQAELSAIFFSLAIRGYRWAYGYMRLERKGARIRWATTKGHFA